MRLPYAVVFALLALGGCLGGDPTDETRADAPAVEASVNETPALAPSANVTPARPPAEPLALHYEGRLSNGVGACVVAANRCEVVEPVASEQAWAPARNGTLTRVALTMWWNATTPATQTLRLGVTHGTPGSRENPYVDGASPLTMTLEGLVVGVDQEFEVWGFTPSAGGSEAAWVTYDQPFTLDALVTVEG